MRFSKFDIPKPDSQGARAALALGRRQDGRSMRGMGLVLLMLCLGWVACKKKSGEVAGPQGAAGPQAGEIESVALEVNGFNYTDLYIDNFSVAGVGGGNIFVSSPDSGGGKSTCCLRWYPGVSLPFPVVVEWTRDRKRFCEQEVMIRGPVPSRPQHVVVQFFPDGHIEVELTEELPEVKIRMERFSLVERKKSGNAVLDEQNARCHDAFH